MKFNVSNRVFWLSLVCAAALTACGGGGGGGTADGSADAGNGGSAGSGGSTQTPGTPGTPNEFNVAEYIGTWAGDTSSCFSSFAYGNYYYRLTTLVFAEKTAEVTTTAYNDAACTSKAGRVIERYNVSWAAGNVAGKSNVARATLVYAQSSTTGADGGTGLSLNKLPDGSSIGSGGKLLLDVDGNKLYGALDSPLDADGFRTVLNPNSFATKQ